MRDRPLVQIETKRLSFRDGGEVAIMGQLGRVFVDGEEWRVTSIGTHSKPDGLTEVTVTFYGRVEFVDAA